MIKTRKHFTSIKITGKVYLFQKSKLYYLTSGGISTTISSPSNPIGSSSSITLLRSLHNSSWVNTLAGADLRLPDLDLDFLLQVVSRAQDPVCQERNPLWQVSLSLKVQRQIPQSFLHPSLQHSLQPYLHQETCSQNNSQLHSWLPWEHAAGNHNRGFPGLAGQLYLLRLNLDLDWDLALFFPVVPPRRFQTGSWEIPFLHRDLSFSLQSTLTFSM